jgi:shikimate dehydrogenase
MTDRYAVIGNPVAHSKSPRIHAEFARQTGEALSYDKLHAELPDFEAAVRRFREEGGRGLNVTVPFKHRAHALASSRSVRAEQAGAVNTLSFAAEGIAGDNTDGIGLVRDLTVNLGCEIAGRRVLLLGAGGASFGVCGPLLAERPDALVIANRSPENAVALAARFEAFYPGPFILGRGLDVRGTFDMVINATSAGLSGETLSIAQGVFGRDAIAYDMVYGRPTPFLKLAAAAGARTADGLGMLVEQAAESFHIWRGVRPETAPVIALLRSETGA